MKATVSVVFILAEANAFTYNLSPIQPRTQPYNKVSANYHDQCTELSTIFGSALHYPNNDSFTIWDAKQQEVRPACQIEPSTPSEVSQVLEILVHYWCYFSVKGGGHSRNPGDSNSVGGVTVDLDRMTQVYEALDAHNLSFVGGRVGTVGVGGFTLGGGTSPFSNKYGWALDNVYEYEVVLANGTIVNANETHNRDLYFALRGGGNNFGIVTAFTVRTFSQGPVSTTTTTYLQNQTEQVLDQVYQLFTDDALTSDVEMGYDMYYTYVSQDDSFSLSGTQRYGKPVRNPAVFKAIYQIPRLTRSTTISNMGNLTRESEPLGTTRHLFATLTVLPSRSLLTQAVRIFEQEARAIRSVDGLVPNLISYAISRTAIAAMAQRGGNSLGIHGDQPLFLILISTAWSDARDDAAVNTMTENAIRRIREAAETLNVAHPFLYVNYASAAQASEVFSSYGEKNVQSLRDIQRAVDPHGVFTSRGLWSGFAKLL
ncbi:FAD linked oxidase domain-containing protein [Aspergillus oryzae]|uniref:FAD linked oxidase domain-containing protein n=1 Tax=Aspergillus oryzae TaxID=5062 RepID=A0A1S9DXV8_ASPOZ|nr:FAD linked oxidase domain-containing protein [Aspergillus oryzae]